MSFFDRLILFDGREVDLAHALQQLVQLFEARDLVHPWAGAILVLGHQFGERDRISFAHSLFKRLHLQLQRL